MARMAMTRSQRCTIGQGERLIRLIMALFYGQTISVHYITHRFNVSARTARRDLTQLAFVLEPVGLHHWRLSTLLKI